MAGYLSDEEIRRRAEQRLNKRRELLIHAVVFALINAALWLAWIFGRGIIGDPAVENFPAPLIVLLGWGAGLAGHAVDVYYNTARRALETRERAVRDYLMEVYGTSDSAELSPQDYKRARQTAEKHYRQRAEFAIHLAVFIPINIMLWLIWLGSTDIIDDPDVTNFPFPIIVMLGWGAGLFGHAAHVYGERMGSTSREGALQREIERERELLYGEVSKAKRKEKREHQRARIQTADDASLEVVDADSDDVDTAAYDDDLRARSRR